jgi:hypothetical protein
VASGTKNGRKPACRTFMKPSRQAYNYHPFYISMLYLFFFLPACRQAGSLLPALNINSSF